MKITVKIKNNYGNEIVYPVCNVAKIFAEMTDKKTLTPSVIRSINKLGYEIEDEAQTLGAL